VWKLFLVFRTLHSTPKLRFPTSAEVPTSEWVHVVLSACLRALLHTLQSFKNVFQSRHLYQNMLRNNVQGCHILEKSWIFLLSWKVLEFCL